MFYNDLVQSLMDARRKAQLQGTTPTQQEVAGLAEGFYTAAGNRAINSDYLTSHKEMFNKNVAFNDRRRLALLKAAEEARRNEMISNLANSGISLYGMMKYGGR